MRKDTRFASPMIITLCALSWFATSLPATALGLNNILNPTGLRVPPPPPVPPLPTPHPTPPRVEVQVDPTRLSSPVSVTAGSLTVTPTVLPAPPAVHADPKGALGKEIDKVSEIGQVPVKMQEKALTLPFDAAKALKSYWNQLMGFKQSAKNFINWLKHLAPKAIALLVAALFGIVFLAVILARLAMKPFDKTPSRTPRLSK